MSLIAIVFAVPLSIGIALFATEVRPAAAPVVDHDRRWICWPSVPSVVFGLWGFIVLRPYLNDIYNWIHDHVSSVPVLKSIFGPSGGGSSFMTAGLIVALMITPIITSITREVFLTVPAQRQGRRAGPRRDADGR